MEHLPHRWGGCVPIILISKKEAQRVPHYSSNKRGSMRREIIPPSSLKHLREDLEPFRKITSKSLRHTCGLMGHTTLGPSPLHGRKNHSRNTDQESEG